MSETEDLGSASPGAGLGERPFILANLTEGGIYQFVEMGKIRYIVVKGGLAFLCEEIDDGE